MNPVYKHLKAHELKEVHKETKNLFGSIHCPQVNNLNVFDFSFYNKEQMAPIVKSAKQLKIIPKNKQVLNVALHSLSGSVLPHEDESFAHSIGAKMVYFIILSIEKQENKDSGIYFYCKRSNALTEINYGDVTRFNPSKEHAILSNDYYDILVFWTT